MCTTDHIVKERMYFFERLCKEEVKSSTLRRVRPTSTTSLPQQQHPPQKPKRTFMHTFRDVQNESPKRGSESGVDEWRGQASTIASSHTYDVPHVENGNLSTPKSANKHPPIAYYASSPIECHRSPTTDQEASTMVEVSANLLQNSSAQACRLHRTPGFKSKTRTTRFFKSKRLHDLQEENDSDETKTLHHQTIRARNQRRRTLQEKDRCMAAMCGSVPQLFESVLIITLEPVSSTSDDSDRKPMITYRFPEDEDAEEVPPELFFPDHSRAQRRKYCNEEFVMALTDVKGARKNAYCLKFLNSRDDHKKGSYPGVLVVISPIRNDIFYLDLARTIHKYLERGTIRLTHFLEAIFNHSYPQVKGASLVVVEKCSEVTGRPDLIEIFNQGTILGRNGLAKIVERISPEITTCIIASLLGEQRILLADHTVCAVSKLVQSMEALIQPFCWPHVFIPAVPDNLIDLCHNPTPYLMGILRNNLVPIRDLITATADTENIEQMDFVFIDADTGLIYPPPEPYVCNTNIIVWKQQCAVRFCKRLGMPKKVSMALITGLRAALVDGTGASADLRIENMMLIWYASLFGHYKNITCQCDWGGQQFKQRLVENQPDKVIRPYLSYLTETVMFHEWIMKRSESTFAEPTDPLPGTEDYLNRQIDKLYSAGVNCFTTKRLAKLFTKVTAVLRVKK